MRIYNYLFPDMHSRVLIITLSQWRVPSDIIIRMEKQMKKLVGLVVILAALILGSYYGMGMLTERALKKNIAMMSQPNGLVLDIEQYNRGLCRSSALLNLTLHVPARIIKNKSGVETMLAAQDYKMQMPLDIYHGPIMIVNAKPMFGLGYAHSDVVLPEIYAKQFKEEYTADSTFPVLNLNLFVSYASKTSIHMELPTFKLISKEGNTQFDWLGMDSDLTVSAHRNAVRGNVKLAGVAFKKDEVNAVLSSVVSDYDLHRTPTGLYLGDGNLNLSKVVVNQNDKPAFEIDELNLHSMNDVNNGLFDGRFKITLKTLIFEGKTYGPALLDVSLSNLDAAILAKLNEKSNELQQGTDAERHQLMLSMLPDVPKLLSKGAVLDLSAFSVVTPDGLVKGNLRVTLPNADIGNPFQLIQKIQGQGKFVFADALLKQLMTNSAKKALQNQAALSASVIEPVANATIEPVTSSPADASANVTAPTQSDTPPAAQADATPALTADIDQQALSQANERLAAMVQSGLLSLQGSDYVIELKLADGQLQVNGKPFNPAMMQF